VSFEQRTSTTMTFFSLCIVLWLMTENKSSSRTSRLGSANIAKSCGRGKEKFYAGEKICPEDFYGRLANWASLTWVNCIPSVAL
jgi:hypothetical protein